MYFKVTDITHPPRFVPPTPPNNQKYTIYVGGDFHVNVYARPTLENRYILSLKKPLLFYININITIRDSFLIKTIHQCRHNVSYTI